MWVYYMIFLLSLSSCSLDFYDNSKIKRILYTLLSVFLIFIVGFRAVGIDNDSEMYIAAFERLQNTYERSEKFFELGYVAIIKLISFFEGKASVQFIIFAVITGISNYLFFYKKSYFPFLSLFLYLSLFWIHRDFNQIRFSLCCSIVFWAIYFFNINKFSSVALIILAAQFHNTAWLILPLLLIANYISNRQIYFIMIIVCIFLGLSFNIFHIIFQIAIENMSFLGIYKYYLVSHQGRGSYSIILFGILTIILFNIVYDKEGGTNLEIYHKLVCISVALGGLFIQSEISQRIILALFQFSVILIPSIIFKIYTTNEKVGYYVYVLLALITLVHGFRTININVIRPYYINQNLLR